MKPVIATFAAVEQAMAGMGRTISQTVGTAFSKLLAPLKGVADAAWMVMQPFQQLSGAMMPFLSALNPAVANALSYSMRELQATFGLLITPIAQELIPVIQEVAAAFQPVFRAMAPMLKEFSRVFARIVALLARTFARVLEAMAPVLEQALQYYADMVTILSPLITVFGELIAAIMPVIKVITGIFQDAMRFLAKVAILCAAAMLRLVGATDILDKMIVGLRDLNKRGEMSSGLQSVQNVQYSNANDFGRSLALAATMAAQSGPGQEKKNMDDLTREILTNLEAMRGDDWQTAFGQKLEKLFKDLGNQIIRGLKGGAFEAIEGAAKATGQGGGFSIADRFLRDGGVR